MQRLIADRHPRRTITHVQSAIARCMWKRTLFIDPTKSPTRKKLRKRPITQTLDAEGAASASPAHPHTPLASTIIPAGAGADLNTS